MSASIVLDTSVLISGLRSAEGASHELLRRLGGTDFLVSISVPLILEYEAVAKRQARELGLTFADIDDFLDYICQVADHCAIFYLWRPFLPDPTDDLLLELAVEAGADFIVTHNLRHFNGADQFGVTPISPGDFLRRLRVVP
ncbi:MAG: PIN domain-containing protein [Gemmatimonadaceae bacterium]